MEPVEQTVQQEVKQPVSKTLATGGCAVDAACAGVVLFAQPRVVARWVLTRSLFVCLCVGSPFGALSMSWVPPVPYR